jgi:uncharacterized protein
MRSSRRLGVALALGTTLLAPAACVLARPAPVTIAPPPASLGAETVVFPSGSGSLIHAWLARGRVGGGAVLLLHGVGDNRTSMLGRAEFLHAMGFTILAPDFQAHGESPGKHITFGARESLDAAAAINFLRQAVPDERIGVIGISMGGAASLLGPGPLDANALVLESVYPTIRQAVSDRLGTWFGPFGRIGRSFTPAVIHYVAEEIGVSETELQPIAHIGAIHSPLLFITGTADHYTPLVEAESLYARAPSPKTFWAVKGAGHEDLYKYSRTEYEQRVGSFLANYLRQGAISSTRAAR